MNVITKIGVVSMLGASMLPAAASADSAASRASSQRQITTINEQPVAHLGQLAGGYDRYDLPSNDGYQQETVPAGPFSRFERQGFQGGNGPAVRGVPQWFVNIVNAIISWLRNQYRAFIEKVVYWFGGSWNCDIWFTAFGRPYICRVNTYGGFRFINR